MPSITMYSADWCADCRRAKAFLDRHDLPYDVVNIEENPDAAELVQQKNEGKRRIPTLDIDGQFYGNPPLSELGRILGVSN
jgi:thioredoxin reductase (NADPH)